jgi:hypothetical protein
MKSLTRETLIDTIRSATELPELKRLVGPSDAERAAAEQRLRTLDALSPACEWDSVCPGQEARAARERWGRIAAEQGAYEHAYC